MTVPVVSPPEPPTDRALWALAPAWLECSIAYTEHVHDCVGATGKDDDLDG